MRAICVAAVAVTLCSSASLGATLNFSEAGSDVLIVSSVVNLSNATLTSSANAFYIAPAGYGGVIDGFGGACGATTVPNNSCGPDWTIDFLYDVKNLTLRAVTSGAQVNVSAYLNGGLLSTIAVSTSDLIDFSSLLAIDRLEFKPVASVGVVFGNFSFEAAPVSPVPIPAALPLLASGLGALGFIGWRRKRKAPQQAA